MTFQLSISKSLIYPGKQLDLYLSSSSISYKAPDVGRWIHSTEYGTDYAYMKLYIYILCLNEVQL